MRLLFAEDDKDIAKAVRVLLEHAGYAVDVVHDGQEAFEYAQNADYDGLILDWMMPRMDGLTVLSRLRKGGCSTPCLMLTAKEAVSDRVAGLDAGADDYLTKPFATAELLARIRAMLRRKSEFSPDVVKFEDLELDQAKMELRSGDNTVSLNKKAFQLMLLLMENPRQILSLDQIMEKVWGWDADVESSVVWVNISFLRKKLEELSCHVEILARRGAGYYLEKKK